MIIIGAVSLVSITLLGILPVTIAAPTGKVDGNAAGKKIICYYSSWSGYRPAVGAFTIDDIPVHLCTHVVYAFIGLNNRTWELLVLDPTSDITKGGYRKFTSLKKKNPNLKTMISVGGWVEGGQKYSELVAKPERRKIFVNSVVDFLKWFNFDGLDLDWEFPGSSDRHGRAEDKDNFIELVKELRNAFDKEGWGWSLTAVVPIMRFRVEGGYDVPKLAKLVDHIHLLTYDLRGNWTGFTDVHAPLRAREFDLGDYEGVNVHDGADYWIKAGAPAEKLTVGLALYGRTYTLEDPASNGLHSKLNQKRTAGNPGPYTKANGTLAYYEICELFQSGGWEQKYDDVGDSPYIVKGDQWIGYDDRNSLVRKVQFVQEKGYGGVAIWSVDLDDFRGVCGESRILLHAIYKQLTGRSPLPLDPISLPVPTVSPQLDFIDLQTDSPHQPPSQTLFPSLDPTSGPTTLRSLTTGIAHESDFTTESSDGRDHALTQLPFTILDDVQTPPSLNVVTTIAAQHAHTTARPSSPAQNSSFITVGIPHSTGHTKQQTSLDTFQPSTKTPSSTQEALFNSSFSTQTASLFDLFEPTRTPSQTQPDPSSTFHNTQTPSSLSLPDLEDFVIPFGDRDHFRTTVAPVFVSQPTQPKSISDEPKNSTLSATSSSTEQWTPEVTWDSGLFAEIPSQLGVSTPKQEKGQKVEAPTTLATDKEETLGRLVPEDGLNVKTSPGEDRFPEDIVNIVTLEPLSVSYTSSPIVHEKELHAANFGVKQLQPQGFKKLREPLDHTPNSIDVKTTSETPLAEVSAFDRLPTDESITTSKKTFDTTISEELDGGTTVKIVSSTPTHSTIRPGRKRRPLLNKLSTRRRQSSSSKPERTDAPVTNTEHSITTFHPTTNSISNGQRNRTNRRRLSRPSRRFLRRKSTSTTSASAITTDASEFNVTGLTKSINRTDDQAVLNRTTLATAFHTDAKPTSQPDPSQFPAVTSRKPIRRRIRVRTTTRKTLKETTSLAFIEESTFETHNVEDGVNATTTVRPKGIRKPPRKEHFQLIVANDDNSTLPIARSIESTEGGQDGLIKDHFALPSTALDGDFTALSGTLDEVFIKFAPPSSDDSKTNEKDIPPVCSKGEESFSSHRRCNKYWWCIHGTATLKECARGLTWHQETSSCDWAVKLDRGDCN